MRISDWSSDVCSSDLSTRYQNAVQRFAERHTGFPLGLRVDLSATESSGFRSDLSTLVRRLGIEPDRVVLSLEVTDYVLSSVEAFADLIVEILNSLPGLHRWRAIVLSLSGLPKKIPVKCGETKLRSEEHTSELQSLMRISYAVFCLKKKKQ